MDENRKRAYRFILYWATLETRPIRWIGSRWTEIINPFYWVGRYRHVKNLGALSDWLHNLAHFSCYDFQGFDEERFWKELKCFDNSFPSFGFARYKDIFYKELNRSW